MSDARFALIWIGRTVTRHAMSRLKFVGCGVLTTVLLSLPVSFAFASRDSIAPGQYILYAGGCISCHTNESGPDLAGGVPFETPFGLLYSTNITPDVETGIGGWSNEQFANAMRRGVLPDGSHLYPAFPYTSYTLLSDKDIDLLYDYLMSLPPVRFEPPNNALRFPFNQRWLMGIWKRLFFEERRFVPAPDQSDQWNRGAYLVEGLGHCGACHTPRGLLGNEKQHLAMTGATYRDDVDGKFLDWSATNLTQADSGLGLWSQDHIEEYLQLGFSERAGVFGPMNRVVLNSTSHLDDHDIIAMAVYLKSLPAVEQNVTVSNPPPDVMRRGEIVYDVHCGICHQPNGEGAITTGPPLVGSAVALAPDPASLINITLYGPQLPHEPVSPQWQARRWEAMESYYDVLNDREVAEVLTYIRNAWTNNASVVSEAQVRRQR